MTDLKKREAMVKRLDSVYWNIPATPGNVLYIAISAAMAAVVPGTQRKRTKEWAAIRQKGFNAALRALRRAR